MKRLRAAILAGTALLPAGCAANPNVEIAGSFFPAWLLCLLGGIGLALGLRRLFARWDVDRFLTPPLLVYGCLAAGLTFLLWILLFS